MREEFVNALLGEEAPHTHGHHHGSLHAITTTAPRVFTDESGVRFEVDSGKYSGDALPIGQMRNGKWVAYAARALVIRFWDLAKVRHFLYEISSSLTRRAESRLARHFAYSCRIHLDAYHILSPPHPLSVSWILLLAATCHPFVSRPRSIDRSPDSNGPQDPH